MGNDLRHDDIVVAHDNLDPTEDIHHHLHRFVDPAFGFALGWNYWLKVR
jgi:hypothetical protein